MIEVPRACQSPKKRDCASTIAVLAKIILCTLSLSFLSAWSPGDTFERNGSSKGAYPATVTPATVTPAPVPAPIPKPVEPVRKPLDPVRCPDCLYSMRCFRLLKFWITVSGTLCKQSHRKRQNYPLIPEEKI
jgi:hypothetical protein